MRHWATTRLNGTFAGMCSILIQGIVGAGPRAFFSCRVERQKATGRFKDDDLAKILQDSCVSCAYFTVHSLMKRRFWLVALQDCQPCVCLQGARLSPGLSLLFGVYHMHFPFCSFSPHTMLTHYVALYVGVGHARHRDHGYQAGSLVGRVFIERL